MHDKEQLNNLLRKELKKIDLHTSHRVNALLELGAEVNKSYSNYAPLHLALLDINEHTLDVVKILVAKGADVNAKSNFNRTPLSLVGSNKGIVLNKDNFLKYSPAIKEFLKENGGIEC